MAGVVKARGLGIEGEQCADGTLAQTWDTVEEFALAAQIRVLVDELCNGFCHPHDFLLEPGEVPFDALADSLAGHSEPIGLLGMHALQGIETQDERTQLALAGRGGPTQGGGCRAWQNSAMSRASTRSVLVRRRREPPKALIWAGLTTETPNPASARNSATASQ